MSRPTRRGSISRRLRPRTSTLLYFDPVQTYLTPYIAPRVRERARLPQEEVRLEAVGPHDRPAQGFLRLRQCRSARVAEQCRPARRRAAVAGDGDLHPRRALLHPEQPRARPRRDDGRVEQPRRILAPLPPRQADAVQEHPESILYNFLATPRVNVPRWYLEGSAVFFETWMAGGLGRAQGGYDEMVFRAKVRDHDKFFSPLGLESEGHCRRLPGGGQRLPLRHPLLLLSRADLRP